MEKLYIRSLKFAEIIKNFYCKKKNIIKLLYLINFDWNMKEFIKFKKMLSWQIETISKGHVSSLQRISFYPLTLIYPMIYILLLVHGEIMYTCLYMQDSSRKTYLFVTRVEYILRLFHSSAYRAYEYTTQESYVYYLAWPVKAPATLQLSYSLLWLSCDDYLVKFSQRAHSSLRTGSTRGFALPLSPHLHTWPFFYLV